jgi:hypothetical protein
MGTSLLTDPTTPVFLTDLVTMIALNGAWQYSQFSCIEFSTNERPLNTTVWALILILMIVPPV